jgi:hypothetical protein
MDAVYRLLLVQSRERKKERKKSATCSGHVGDENVIRVLSLWSEYWKERDHMGNTGVNQTIILK